MTEESTDLEVRYGPEEFTTVGFTPAGKLAQERRDTALSSMVYHPRVARCEVCAALVLDEDTDTHADFHWGDRRMRP